MKVIDVKTFAVDCFRTNWMFVKVYTDEGIDGTQILALCKLYEITPNDLFNTQE